jgi:hypothetical protein
MPGISDVTAEGTKQYRDYIRISYGHPFEGIRPFRRLEMDNATALPAIYRLQTLVERALPCRQRPTNFEYCCGNDTIDKQKTFARPPIAH